VVTRTRAEPDGRRRRPAADLGRRLTPAGDFAHGRTGAAGTVASTRSSLAAVGGQPAAGLGRRPGAGRGFRARAPAPPARWPAPGRARPPTAVDQLQAWAGARRRQGISRARTGATGTVASTRQSPAAAGGRPAAGLGRRLAPAGDFARAHRRHRHGGQHQAEPGRRRRSTSCRSGPAPGAGQLQTCASPSTRGTAVTTGCSRMACLLAAVAPAGRTGRTRPSHSSRQDLRKASHHSRTPHPHRGGPTP